jgi:hypothetical protein
MFLKTYDALLNIWSKVKRFEKAIISLQGRWWWLLIGRFENVQIDGADGTRNDLPQATLE